MARKYKFKLVDFDKDGPDKVVGEVEATSYRDARAIGMRQFGETLYPRVELTDNDIKYLRRVSINALMSGRDGVRDMAMPWFSLQMGHNVDETHYKNIVDAMPDDLQIAYYRAHEEWDELSRYGLTSFIGYDPVDEIKELPPSQQTPEAYAKIFGNFLRKAVKTEFRGYQNEYENSMDDTEYDNVLYYLMEHVPKNKFSSELNTRIREFILAVIANKQWFGHSALEDLPASVYTEKPVFVKKLLQYYPSWIFDLPRGVADVKLWAYALRLAIRGGGFTSSFGDIGSDEFVDYNMPEEVKNDPRIKQLIVAYDESERRHKEEQERKWQEERDARMKAHMDNVSSDGMKLSGIHRNWHTPEMYTAAIANNPKAIFHVPSDARTKELWIQAVKADSSILNFVRPMELQAEIKQELGDKLANVKKNLKNDKYAAAIAKNPKAIFNVPSADRTKEMWIQAVKADSYLINFVRPIELQTEIKQLIEK